MLQKDCEMEQVICVIFATAGCSKQFHIEKYTKNQKARAVLSWA
jgi:hypothetical protein